MNSRTYCSRILPSVRATAAVMIAATFTAPAWAQWPTSYLEPKVLTSGPDIRVGSVLVTGDGNVVACVDSYAAGTRRILTPKFDPAGNQLWPGDHVYTFNAPTVKAQLLSRKDDPSGVNLATQLANPQVDNVISNFIYQNIDEMGWWGSANFYQHRQFQAAINSPTGEDHLVWFDPSKNLVGCRKNKIDTAEDRDIGENLAEDFSMVSTSDENSLIAFTKRSYQMGTPGQIWLFSFIGGISPYHGSLLRAQNQDNESQSKATLIHTSSFRNALTWIGELQGSRKLYVKEISNSGAEVTAGRQVLPDVLDYVVANSTLGVPVFAGVQRNNATNPPVDTLFSGLLDPATGGSVTMPIAVGLGVKVKSLRQEANGDFSLIYSIPENGTNLLKVRRISGTSATTLWETIVADLGSPTEEVLEKFPNTFVTSGADDALYILSRYDKPYSVISSFSLARLRADGQLGADSLIAPTDLEATNAGPGNVKLTWSDNTSVETHYLVGRTTTDFSGIEILTALPANSTTFTDTTAESLTKYRYYVAAYQADTGNYLLSNEVEITPPQILIEL